jgi:hypothetical protein
VDTDRRSSIPPVIVVVVAVIRMAVVAVVMHVQVVGGPTNCEGGSHAPEISAAKRMTVRVWVVVYRIRARMVIVNRLRLINDDTLRLVVGNVNDFFIDRCDFNDTFVVRHVLVVIAF